MINILEKIYATLLKQTNLMQHFNSNTPSLAVAAWCDTEVGSHHRPGSLNNLLAVYSNIGATYVCIQCCWYKLHYV